MLSVMDAVKASSGFKRPMLEGEQVLKGKLVIGVGVKSKEEDVYHIQALVMRTSGLSSEHPYLVELWIDLSKDFGERVVEDHSNECECPAGLSQKCKHIMAVILYLARTDESELDDLSCTDVEQQWGALRIATLKEYEAKELKQLCHVASQKDAYVSAMPEVTKEMEAKWENRLLNCKRNLMAKKNKDEFSGDERRD